MQQNLATFLSCVIHK